MTLLCSSGHSWTPGCPLCLISAHQFHQAEAALGRMAGVGVGGQDLYSPGPARLTPGPSVHSGSSWGLCWGMAVQTLCGPCPHPAPCQREAPPPQPELLLGEDCGGGAGAGWKQACLSLPWSQPKAPSSGSGGRRHTSLGACEHKGPGLRLGPVGGCVPGVWVGGRLQQLLPCPPQGKVL